MLNNLDGLASRNPSVTLSKRKVHLRRTFVALCGPTVSVMEGER